MRDLGNQPAGGVDLRFVAAGGHLAFGEQIRAAERQRQSERGWRAARVPAALAARLASAFVA